MFGSSNSGEEAAPLVRRAICCPIAFRSIIMVEGYVAKTAGRWAKRASATDLHGVDWLCRRSPFRHCDCGSRHSDCSVAAAPAVGWVRNCWRDLSFVRVHSVCMVTVGLLSRRENIAELSSIRRDGSCLSEETFDGKPYLSDLGADDHCCGSSVGVLLDMDPVRAKRTTRASAGSGTTQTYPTACNNIVNRS